MGTSLMEEVAIPFPAGEAAAFFFGDNRDGYYEGITHREAAGCGYWMRDRALFRDFVAFRDGRELARARATGATLYPYGVRHQHGTAGWDELMVLHRQHALALRLHSPRVASLALGPLLDLSADERPHFESVGKTLLLPLPRAGLFLACASPQAFRLEELQTRGTLGMPVFRTLRPEVAFTLYLAFATSRDQALAQAERLRDGDGVEQHKRAIQGVLTRCRWRTSDPAYNRAVAWSQLSSYFMVTEDPGPGIWAGLPWFRENWGRDTFIALPGTLLVTGHFDEARDVIRAFARYQQADPSSPDFGRIPNRVRSPKDMIYNTADGTPWFLRELLEYIQYTGDLAFARELYPVVQRALQGLTRRSVDREGFLTHDDADSWMDARIEGRTPWSPRGNRAVEIQVLWHEALRAGVRMAEYCGDLAAARRWNRQADRLKRRFLHRFWDGKNRRMADRVTSDQTPDFRVRPNQLMLLSVPLDTPFLAAPVAKRVLRNAVTELLFPHGIASLSQRDPWFHPYHDGRAEYHKDAAYHNGTVWGWNAGFTTSALVRQGQVETAWRLARNLTKQVLQEGCRGGMSELVDAWPGPRGKPMASGTWQQAWSTSEFVRNAFQDFAGFCPRLLDGHIELSPHWPRAWTEAEGTFRFGRSGRLNLLARRGKKRDVFTLCQEGAQALPLRFTVVSHGRRHALTIPLGPAEQVQILCDRAGATVLVNGRKQRIRKGTKASPPPRPLPFARPDLTLRPSSLRQTDFLRSQHAEPAR